MAKVFVSGSFDLLHSGHVAFFKEAAKHGDLYVGVGRDRSIEKLKGRKTIYPQEERLYMVRAIRYVKNAWLNTGMGMNDFFEDMIQSGVKTLIVNKEIALKTQELQNLQKKADNLIKAQKAEVLGSKSKGMSKSLYLLGFEFESSSTRTPQYLEFHIL